MSDQVIIKAAFYQTKNNSMENQRYVDDLLSWLKLNNMTSSAIKKNKLIINEQENNN